MRRTPTARPRRAAALAALLVACATACAPAEEPAGGTAAPSGSGSSGSGSSGSGTSGSGSSGAGGCPPGALATRTPGTLTLGTDQPAYEPWFVDSDPSNGRGYESAVAYAIAERLGYARDAVTWVPVTFTDAIAPGPKSFDLDLNQVSISEERRRAVDFSSGYYDVAQAVVTTEGSPIAGATTLAELRGAKLGAQVGTTSYETVVDVIQPSAEAAVFDSNDLAKQALVNGQVDGIVVDLPTAFYMAAAEVEGGKVLGQVAVTGEAEQFGAVLDKGSPLTACVSQAVEQLRAAGTLAALEQQWLTSAGSAPDLR